jgi:hypothetical protein
MDDLLAHMPYTCNYVKTKKNKKSSEHDINPLGLTFLISLYFVVIY